jgi:drug/metabolite transporter superfamily protein YnfA
MTRHRPPVLLFESDRGRELRFFSFFLWSVALLAIVTGWLSLADILPSGDNPRSIFLGQAVLVALAFFTDRQRRKTATRVYRVQGGLVFEMAGLFWPIRRYVRPEDLAKVTASAPDVKARMRLRLPDGGSPIVMHTGSEGLNLGLPEPAKRRR